MQATSLAGEPEVDLLFNDLSLHGQFPDVKAFRAAMGQVMEMRNVARQFGHDLPCHRNAADAQVTQNASMKQAIQQFGRSEQQAIMQWLTQYGPFWEDLRAHGPNDYLECNGDVVTDTAVGEAAYDCFQGGDSRLVSLSPSSWTFTPVSVIWRSELRADPTTDVLNYWQIAELQAALATVPDRVASWDQLEAALRARCARLTFSEGCFEPLRGLPFVELVARRVTVLVATLDELRSCIDSDGRRTQKGQQIYQDHFTGKKPWFSDSSATEKNEFRSELTFPHPARRGELVLCPWHGKVKTPQFRVHFTWPVSGTEPLYVVYVGPKITKR